MVEQGGRAQLQWGFHWGAHCSSPSQHKGSVLVS